MDAPWKIVLLGGLQLQERDRVITRFKSQKIGALLAYLAYHPRRHSREALIERFWPESGQAAGRNSLSAALSSLRHQLEPPGTPVNSVIQADRLRVGLNPVAVTTDVALFEAAVKAGAKAKTGQERMPLLTQAVELYQGSLLPGYDDAWIIGEQERLSGLFFECIDGLIAALEEADEGSNALQYARHAVRIDPLREEAQRTLIRLLAATGQPAAARRQYQEYERRLAEEIGMEPSDPLRRLVRQIETQANIPPPHVPPVRRPPTAAVAPTTEPTAVAPILRAPQTVSPLHVEPPPTTHLPMRFTRFFGRQREISLLVEMLRPGATPSSCDLTTSRLVTLSGSGGAGKTRLAVEVAERLSSTPQGVIWFVRLADLTDPLLIPDTILAELRVSRSSQREALDQVVETLAKQPSLLILDNLEHLLPNGAHIVQSLLERVPTLRCVVTSRQLLGLTSEREFTVTPLPLPEGSETPEQLSCCDSVALFVDRAQTAMPDFQVTHRNAAAVAELCRRLEGLPLAIELAAARALVLTPAQMLGQLERRFDFLISRKRDYSERQRTLWAAIDWSYRLLAPDLQQFFARLAVFRGGWTLEAAEAVCQEPLTLDHLAQLRESSLILTAEQETDPTTIRFRMLETIREYAYETLSASEARADAHRRHCHCFLLLAEQAEPHLHGGPDQTVWLDRLEQERDNVRAALAWCRQDEEESETQLRLAGALTQFWIVRSHLSEGREHLAAALSRSKPFALKEIGIRAHNGAAFLAYFQGDYTATCLAHERALALSHEVGNRTEEMRALYGLGRLASDRGDYPRSRLLHEQALKINREIGDRYAEAWNLHSLGIVAREQGELAAARSLYERALALSRQLEERDAEAYNLYGLGRVAYCEGDMVAARAFHEQALAINQTLMDRAGQAWNLRGLGDAAREAGQFAAAREHYLQALTIRHDLAVASDMPAILESLAALAARQGRSVQAARLWGKAAALREGIGNPVPLSERTQYDRDIEAVRALLGEAVFTAAWTAGTIGSLEQAVLEAQADA